MANAKVIKLTDNSGNILLPLSDSAYVQHKWKEGLTGGTTITSVQDALNSVIDRVDGLNNHAPGSDNQWISYDTSTSKNGIVLSSNHSSGGGNIKLAGSGGTTISYTSNVLTFSSHADHDDTQTISYTNGGGIKLSGKSDKIDIEGSGLITITGTSNKMVIGTTATNNTGTVTKVEAGTGLVSSPTTGITSTGSISHGQVGAVSKTYISTSGKYFSELKFDQFGHLNSYTTANLPTFTDTNTTVLTNGTTDVTADHKSSQKITLTGGTNKFTVKQGSSQFDVSITPSISNNVTGNAAWTKASYLTATNAASGNVIKQSTLAIDDVATKNYVTDEIGKLGKALNWVGVSTTDPKGTSGATVSGHTTWKSGDVVGYNSKEYVLTGTSNTAANWRELGDESSWAMTGTTTCSPGDGMTGSVTTVNAAGTSGVIDHAVPDGASAGKKDSASNNFIKSVTTDKFGHITAYTTGTYSVTHQNHKFTNKAAGTSGNYELKLDGSNSSVYFTPANGAKLTASGGNTLTISGTSVSVAKAVSYTSGMYAVIGKDANINDDWLSNALGTPTGTTYIVNNVSNTTETVWDYT